MENVEKRPDLLLEGGDLLAAAIPSSIVLLWQFVFEKREKGLYQF